MISAFCFILHFVLRCVVISSPKWAKACVHIVLEHARAYIHIHSCLNKKQFHNDIHMQEKYQLKATATTKKVTAQWKSFEFHKRNAAEEGERLSKTIPSAGKRIEKEKQTKNQTSANQTIHQTNWAAYFSLVSLSVSLSCFCVRFLCRTNSRNKTEFISWAWSLLRTEKNIYMLNYDLTLLFKQFILMLVAVASATTVVVAVVQSHSIRLQTLFPRSFSYWCFFLHSFCFGFVFNKSKEKRIQRLFLV